MLSQFEKKEGRDYISNFYRYKLYDKESKHYLLTTDDGNFLFLNNSAFLQLKKGKINDEKIYKLLLEKGIIINSSNFNTIVEKTKQKYSFLENGTSLHIVIPTHRCNLSCVYCFASSCPMEKPKNDTDMDEKTAKKIVEFIMKSPSNAITIEFQGGEPLVRFDTIKLMVQEAQKLNKIYKKDLRLALVSNMTLMCDEYADWLIENNVSFCTSLDGPKDVHDKNRFIFSKSGVEIGTYEKVVYWIRRINQKYKEKNINLKVNALMTITKSSLPYYKEIIDEYITNGIHLLHIRGLTRIGEYENNETAISYDYEEFVEFYSKSLEYISKLNQDKLEIIERIKELFEIKILENKPTYYTEHENPCGAATGQITYFNDGNIYTCNEALGRDEFKIGNVFNDKWQEVFKRTQTSKAILNSMLEQNVICDRCVYKPYCGTCMVENFYKDNKFNFYPTKTSKHYETIYHSNKIFDKMLKKIKEAL